MKQGENAYSDEQYDHALYLAIQKAEDYLQPFFKYDLGKIYAIAWDCEENGGLDGDRMTLAVRKENGQAQEEAASAVIEVSSLRRICNRGGTAPCAGAS